MSRTSLEIKVVVTIEEGADEEAVLDYVRGQIEAVVSEETLPVEIARQLYMTIVL